MRYYGFYFFDLFTVNSIFLVPRKYNFWLSGQDQRIFCLADTNSKCNNYIYDKKEEDRLRDLEFEFVFRLCLT